VHRIFVVIESAKAVVVFGVKRERRNRRDSLAVVVGNERERPLGELHTSRFRDICRTLDHNQKCQCRKVASLGQRRWERAHAGEKLALVEQPFQLRNRCGDDRVCGLLDRSAVLANKEHLLIVGRDTIDLGAELNIEIAGEPLCQVGHAGRPAVAGVAVLVTEPATPFTNCSVTYRSCDGRLELVASSREELGPMIEPGLADPTSC